MSAVTLCIINYNGLGYLQRALTAIHPFCDQFAEILIVDNSSGDGSQAYIRSLSGIRLVESGRNLGPGAARNLGFAAACNDLILFQDNDVELNSETAQHLLAALRSAPDILAVAPRVRYRERPQLIQYDSADCHTLGLMSVRHANRCAEETPAGCTATSSLVTACFLIDRRRWHGGALFDDGLIFNLEDHDFGVRANLLGHTLLVNEQTSVLHGGGTEGLSWRPGYALQSQRMFCLIRNRWWILLRYYSGRTLLILTPYLLLFEILQFAAATAKGWPAVYPAAMWSTVRRLPLLLRQRRSYQRARCRPDTQILRPGPLPLTAAMRSPGLSGWLIRLFERSLERYSRFTGLHPSSKD